ncbi:MAG: GGDEF domain-containing protein [Geobacteraceae bacterium]|nr:GGDEF domain-containing protein [Geobacteraceae bacterium]
MNLNELLNIKARNNPDSLLRLLVTTAAVSIIVVVMFSGYGFYRVFSGFVIKTAENNSVQLCRVLIEQEKNFIFAQAPGKAVELGLDGSGMLAFDKSLRSFLSPFKIIKVKVYDVGKRIVYSTDPALIGRVDHDNLRLQNALSGRTDAKLVNKDSERDLSEERLLDVDVVETYVPIVDNGKRVLGCFEIYMNVTCYRQQIVQGAALMTVLLSLVLLAVFGFSYLLIRGGTGQLKDVQSQLETIAITDQLTGIANRRYLMKRGEEEFERIQRSTGAHRKSLGCIMLDLDFFKQINDSKGHMAGDQVLHEVARRLKNCLRPYDVVGRYGGEEFVVMLPDTSFEQSLLVADRIRNKIRNEPFTVEGEPLAITVSLGVSGSGEGDRALTEIIKRADEALYKAKADGRDRVSWIYHPFDTEIHS